MTHMAIGYPYPMLIFLCLPSGVSDPAFTKLLKGVLSPSWGCSIGKKEVQNKTAVWECLLLSIWVFPGKPCVQGQCQVLRIQRWKMLDLRTLRTSVRDTTCHSLEYIWCVLEALLTCLGSAQEGEEFCLENLGWCHWRHGIEDFKGCPVLQRMSRGSSVR